MINRRVRSLPDCFYLCSFSLRHFSQLNIMFVGGPNIRKDYHIEEGEEVRDTSFCIKSFYWTGLSLLTRGNSRITFGQSRLTSCKSALKYRILVFINVSSSVESLHCWNSCVHSSPLLMVMLVLLIKSPLFFHLCISISTPCLLQLVFLLTEFSEGEGLWFKWFITFNEA